MGFGLALRKQVEDRLDFYATGAAPQKNEDAMKSAMDAVLGDIKVADPTADADMADIAPRAIQKQEKKSKDKESKKDKKRRHSEAAGDEEELSEKKKKKRARESPWRNDQPELVGHGFLFCVNLGWLLAPWCWHSSFSRLSVC